LIGAIVLIAIIMVKVAHAQTVGQITFTAQTTTGNGSVTPVLTWATTPAATNCTASGSWTGTKTASGTQTLAAITQSATYNLTCTWPNDTVVVSWTPATKNTDNTTYSDPKAVRVYWGTQANPLASTRDVAVPATSTTVTGLTPNTYVFSATSVNQLNVESAQSTPTTVAISNATATKAIGITVNPIPMPPTNLAAT
jgi:hypothetical protein